MRLDFNEANILIRTIEDLEKYKKPVTRKSVIDSLNELGSNTDKNLAFIRQSISSLSTKLERLSDKSISKIQSDAHNKNISATACYTLPDL